MERLNKPFLKFTLKLVCLGLVIVILSFFLSPFFVPKWNTVDDNYVGTNIKGFYAEDKSSLNALYIGNSSVFCGISPNIIEKTYGIKGYNIAIGGIKTWTEYYLLKCALEYQSPQVVLIDVECAFEGDENVESKTRKAFDHIIPSNNKIEAVFSPAYNHDYIESVSYLIPLFRYHDRWQELSSTDFQLAYSYPKSENSGYDLYDKVVPYHGDINYYISNNSKYGCEISSKNYDYLIRIIELCKEKAITPVFMTVPCTETWSKNKHSVISDFCNQQHILFIDMNTNEAQSKIGIDWEKDTCDAGVHLNYDGATKVSEYLGKIINQEIIK